MRPIASMRVLSHIPSRVRLKLQTCSVIVVRRTFPGTWLSCSAERNIALMPKIMVREGYLLSFAISPVKKTPIRQRAFLMLMPRKTDTLRSTSTRPTTHPALITHMQHALCLQREIACRWRFQRARRDITRACLLHFSHGPDCLS